MADLKISGLTALTAADTADLLEIVDVSDTTMAATGTNKKITAGQVLASGLPGSFSTLAASGLSTHSVTSGPIASFATTAVNSYGIVKIIGSSRGGEIDCYNGATLVGAAYCDTSNIWHFAGTGADYAQFSSTGLAVTGALSATGAATISGAINYYNATNAAVRLATTTSAGKLVNSAGSSGVLIYGDTHATNANNVSIDISNVITANFTATGIKTKTTISVGDATPSASGAGITFPATVSASTDVNTLDDYDEYTAASAACTGAITTAAVWKLTKVGNVVTLTLPAVTGTASATSYFAFGTPIPAKYRPADTLIVPCGIKDNGANINTPGMIYISAGAISVYKDIAASGNFTVAAVSGLAHASTAVSWTI